MRLRLLAPLLCALAAPAAGQDATAEAQRAAEGLREAIAALDAAQGGRGRVQALTATTRAYEEGLAALRDGLRRATLRETEIAQGLAARRARIGSLLGAMMAMEAEPVPPALLHPDGPEAAVRAGMILGDVTPALQAEAESLRAELEEVAAIRALHEGTAELLQSGLAAAQEARVALSQAMQDRDDLPRRFLEDPEELRLLVNSAETLEAFATGIAGMEHDIGPPMEDFEGARGALPMPALGAVLRGAGEADAAGVVRPGLLLATPPGALVTAPWPATIRYRGPLLDYGNVMILEPARGYLLVLAGLGSVFGETGEVVDAGAPLGLMGGGAAASPEFGAAPPPAEEAGGAGRTETLYMELRQGRTPLDPADWFAGLGG